jgi:spore coat protein CotH
VTGLRERLAFAVFEAMGIAAPRVVHARVTVNGEYWGVYALTEPVTRGFLKEHLGESDGTLFDYEAVPKQKYHLEFLGPKRKLYIPAPFKPDAALADIDPQVLIGFIRTVNEAPQEGFSSTVAQHLDVKRFLTYVATENALAEVDGLVGDWGINNFYLYQHADSARFTLVPWDKDTSLQAAHWPLMRNMDQCVLTRRLMQSREMRQLYIAGVRKAATSYVNGRWLGQRLEHAYGQIRAAMLADTKKPQRNVDFENGVGGLRDIIRLREADVLKQAP